MLVSYKWIKELIDIEDISPDVLADKMSRSGIEVEDVVVPQDGLKKIVVGDVKECVPHPDSDHLSICQIDVGEEELYQIVCGAPNITAGKKVIVALPNSRITGNVKIKKGKMRGEASLGMVCALQELGYADSVVPKAYAEGIYFMPEDATPGTPVFDYLDMDDAIIELSVTPNRADALSMRGVAHEIGAIYGKVPHFPTKELVEDTDSAIKDYVTVSVTDKEDVPTYRMRVIKDVTVKESPLWLQTKLMNSGIRPINNVVDVTNYTLLLFGQPQHAFDYDKLANKTIETRRAVEGETLVTLDGEERTLSTSNIVITDGTSPIALAGVMGGASTEITDTTTTVALETALFDAVTTRRTARKFGLSSESSKRFERGINVATIEEASAYAAAMIAELGEGVVVTGEVVSNEIDATHVEVSITLDRINHILGTELSIETVNAIFDDLGFGYAEEAGTYTVSVPPRRWDISIEADLVEEVARIYGYDNLPSTLPSGEALPGHLTPTQALTRHLRQHLQGCGLDEAISYALTTEELATRFIKEPKDVVTLDWPMSEERSVLRQNLVSGLLANINYNIARKNKDVAFYEIGNIFEKTTDVLPNEVKHVAMAITGLWKQNDWLGTTEAVDFYTLKGILDSTLDELGLLSDTVYAPTNDLVDMHPGRTANVVIKDQLVGFIGQVHPVVAKDLDINDTYVCELDLALLLSLVEPSMTFVEVGKYPSIKRDMALLADVTVSNQDIVTVIEENAGKFLSDIHLFDLFQGEKLGSGKKSLAYSLVFQNNEATLVDEEVTKAVTKITEALKEQLSIEVR